MEGGVTGLGAASRPLRVVVISDHALARSGIVHAVASQADMAVAGEYDSCRAALAAVMKSPPDAVVLELSPGGGEVLDAISRCHTAFPRVAHVVISQTRDAEVAERAVRAGALAIVHKGVGPQALAAALRDAVAGELHVCRCIASPLLQKAFYGNGRHKTRHPELAKLSAREFQVFQLLGSGWDNARIARELGISVKTLNAHKEHLKARLCAPTSRDVYRFAREWQERAATSSPDPAR